ncbi:hypothetical protein [Rubrobacter aplysinae]|uniref:hypothetical protein n=1 Tax=Rubrobacter aplysinae TaxID=909625 RepID=UPI00128DDE7D|nr:hypothetical protein [Rubrobacter aplysinae]
MSEGSLPPFKYLDPRRYPARLRGAVGRLISRFRRGPNQGGPVRKEPGVSKDAAERSATDSGDSESITYSTERGINPELDGEAAHRPPVESVGAGVGEAERERAVAALREFLEQNATSVERAARKRDQAERLEIQGIPSDSARNRAGRAREEIVDGLLRLRRSLVASDEAGAARALDLEVGKIYPPVSPEEIRPSSSSSPPS